MTNCHKLNFLRLVQSYTGIRFKPFILLLIYFINMFFTVHRWLTSAFTEHGTSICLERLIASREEVITGYKVSFYLAFFYDTYPLLPLASGFLFSKILRLTFHLFICSRVASLYPVLHEITMCHHSPRDISYCF